MKRAVAAWAAAIAVLVGGMVYAERADAATWTTHRVVMHKARYCWTAPTGHRYCTVRWVHRVNRGQR